MPDFLVQFCLQDRLACHSKSTLVPYDDLAVEVSNHALPFGEFSILGSPGNQTRNCVFRNGFLFAWVGDLDFLSGTEKLLAIVDELDRGQESEKGLQERLKESGLLDGLSGAYALVCAIGESVAFVTDPMSSVQVYVGRNSAGELMAVGTHPDLVAALSGSGYEIDPVSVSDFINSGIPCCPFTMHRNVSELTPGSIHVFTKRPDGRMVHDEVRYWTPPEELTGTVDERELINEFQKRWTNSVHRRCDGTRIGVTLSGGLDSRLIMAAIPEDLECVGLTLCDEINREARIARRVAQTYGREWIPLIRDPEYLAQTLIPSTRFTGCEGEWHHAHAIGFASKIREMEIDTVFTGLLMDNNFKGYYARDTVRVPRLGGLFGATHKVVPVDYPNEISPDSRSHIRSDRIDETIDRRRAFRDQHWAMRRESPCEWLDGYPYSQASDNTGWVVERRFMPMKLPVMDRSLVDLAFRVPMRLKAGGKFFDRAAAGILGVGRRIPNANSGVRPGSNHLSKLAQRSVRKLENSWRRLALGMGVKLAVPHSWHDFQGYWATSPAIEDLRRQHGHNLKEFEGSVFKSDPVALLNSRDIPFQFGYRLLQLAVWRSLIREYRA